MNQNKQTELKEKAVDEAIKQLVKMKAGLPPYKSLVFYNDL